MARTAAIRKAETWVYIEDEKVQVEKKGMKTKTEVRPVVKEIAAGGKPHGGGSVFQLGPIPHELYLELGFYGSRKNAEAEGGAVSGEGPSASGLMAQLVRACLIGWNWVVDGDGEIVDFEGPQSIAALDPETKTILGGYLMTRMNEKGKKRGNESTRSEPTRKTKASSGRAMGA